MFHQYFHMKIGGTTTVTAAHSLFILQIRLAERLFGPAVAWEPGGCDCKQEQARQGNVWGREHRLAS